MTALSFIFVCLGRKAYALRSPAACWLCLLLAASAVAQDDADSLARRIFALADAEQFSEVDLLLATLAESHPASQEHVAAALYASERSYAAGNRPQATHWLRPLAGAAAPKFQSAIGDALAWCQVDAADLKVLTARLLELAEQHPHSSFAPVALQLRAEKLVADQRTDEAIFAYHVLLAQFPSARQTPASLLAVARLHHESSQHREAWEYLQRLVQDHPQAHEMDAALYLGAQVGQQLGEQDKARQWQQQLVDAFEHSPYWPDTALRLAEHRLGEDSAAAKKLADRIVQSKDVPHDIAERTRFLLLRIAVADGEWQTVEMRADEILADKPNEPMKTLASFWRAESAYRRGELDQAHTRLLDLSAAIEARTEAWLGVVPLRLAQIEAQREHWATAVEWAELAATNYPRYSRRHEVDYLRGRSLVALARFSEAREILQSVTIAEHAAGTVTAAMAQWLIGETYFQQQQYERAIAAYELTQKCDHAQWSAAALLQAAKCCEQLGRWSDAAQRYEQLLHEHADSRYAAAARTRLETNQSKVAAQTVTDTTTR